jgi:DNA-binding NarL/FixJ family response regulator
MDKKHSEMSHIDHRYCQGCYDLLLKEAEMLTGGRRPAWIPIPSTDAVRSKLAGDKQWGIPQHGARNMSTLASEKTKVDTIQPQGRELTHKKRGPKHRQLQEEIIMQLHREGLGAKAIAAHLKSDKGITVSYKTVQRILSGERNNQGEQDAEEDETGKSSLYAGVQGKAG